MTANEKSHDIDHRPARNGTRRERRAAAHREANVSKRAPHVAPTKARAGKKAAPARKAQKGRITATVAKPKPRAGSKTAKILDLLKRPGGATAKELQKATGWQPHSVRGFLSGTVGKKIGMTVTTAKTGDGERRYSVK